MCHFGGPSPPWSLPFDLCNAPLARFFFVTPNLLLHPVNAVTNNYMKHHCPSRLLGLKDPRYLDFLWSAIIGKRTHCPWGQRWEKYISYLRFPSAATSPHPFNMLRTVFMKHVKNNLCIPWMLCWDLVASASAFASAPAWHGFDLQLKIQIKCKHNYYR